MEIAPATDSGGRLTSVHRTRCPPAEPGEHELRRRHAVVAARGPRVLRGGEAVLDVERRETEFALEELGDARHARTMQRGPAAAVDHEDERRVGPHVVRQVEVAQAIRAQSRIIRNVTHHARRRGNGNRRRADGGGNQRHSQMQSYFHCLLHPGVRPERLGCNGQDCGKNRQPMHLFLLCLHAIYYNIDHGLDVTSSS